MNKYIWISLGAAICVSLLSGCASGPEQGNARNSAALTPRPGRGMVVIYRTPGLAGKLMKPFIWANRTKMPGTLARGGFYTYEAAPGPLRVEFSWKDQHPSAGENALTLLTSGPLGVAMDNMMGYKRIGVDLQVVPNQIHYVLMDGRALSEVSKAEGEEAVAECRWLNPQGR